MSLFHKKLQQSQNQLSMAQQQSDAYKAAMQSYGGLSGVLQGMGQPLGGYSGLQQWQSAPLGAAQAQSRQPAHITLPEEVVIHALVGWRRWSVSMFGETLKSNNGFEWEPYKRTAAKCSAPTCRGVNCGCGIYCYKERKQAEQGENSPTDITHIWGEVWLWGRVIEYTKGFRAQFAYPKALVNSGGISQRLAYVYGVKLIDTVATA